MFNFRQASIFSVALISFGFLGISYAKDYTPTGFYYPVGTEDIDVSSSCGRWLEKPKGYGGCYPSSGVYHIGVDIKANEYTEVRAIADGKVIMRLGYDEAWGKGNTALLVEHQSNEFGMFRAVYGHVKQSTARADKEAVLAGSTIGEIGHWDDGDHLHFGMLTPGRETAINQSSNGRWSIGKYGVEEGGCYDNGFIDPIWFIIHRSPNNWLSRKASYPFCSVYPYPPVSIDVNHPYFFMACIEGGENPNCPCDDSAVLKFVECVKFSEASCAGVPASKWNSLEKGGLTSGGTYGVGGDFFVYNPPDSEDTQSDPGTTSGDYGKVTMSTPSGSSSKPELYGKELRFKDEKTKHYHDEDIKVYILVKNVGIDVLASITKIRIKLFRFEGETENGDTKEMGSENIKGENLESGDTKEEEFQFGAPDSEDVYQFYVRVDTENSVSEANESNNRLGNIRCRVHKRPDIRAKNLTLNDGRTQFEIWEIPEATATLTNDGGEPFVDVKVRWYLDNIHIADDNMRHWNIENGDEKHESVKLVNLEAGSHTIRVCSDLDADHNGENDCKSLEFTVLSPPEPEIISSSEPEPCNILAPPSVAVEVK